MRSLLSLALLFLISAAACQLQAAVIGKNHVIHCREKATVMEEYAAETLQQYIERSTGMKLKITTKLSSPAIRIAYDSKLKREEHLVKALPNGDLLISGGFPSGVIYGAFEFIEKIMGCRFLAPDAEYVPRLKKITFADDLTLQGVPFFLRRGLAYGSGVWHHQMDFLTKLRLSGMWIKGTYVDPYRFGTTGIGHAFHKISKNFPKDKPEYFSLNNEGKRLRSVNGAGPGQICLTHPEVRKIFAQSIVKYIDAGDKWTASLPENKRQVRHWVYSVGKNDNQDDCVCPGCLKLLAKYKGNHAGVFMDFVSDIARRAGKLRKHVLFHFLAYTTDELPVPGYRLPENVMVATAQLGSEFMTRVNRDSMRSIHHPNNALSKKYMLEWRKSAKHYSIWDYWILFRQHYAAPVTNVSALVENIRFYADLKLDHIFAESEISSSTLLSFWDLRYYVSSKLMVDPRQDEKVLISEFMHLYYGKAAPAMTAYLNYLEKRMKEEKAPLGSVAPGVRTYLDKEFYLQSEKFLAAAEAAAAGNKKLLNRIGQERIPVDIWLLHEYKKLGIKTDIKKIVARLKQNTKAAAYKYKDKENAAKWCKATDQLIEACVNAPPLPAEFTTKRYFDFWGDRLIRFSVSVDKVKDPESPTGSACKLRDAKPKLHSGRMEFAVYDWIGKKHLLRKKLAREDLPQDEKYHWYKVGKTKLTARTQLIFHPTWFLSQRCGNAVYDPLEPNAEYEFYASVKVTGPAYVNGSQKDNAVYLDRVVFLECPRNLPRR